MKLIIVKNKTIKDTYYQLNDKIKQTILKL